MPGDFSAAVFFAGAFFAVVFFAAAFFGATFFPGVGAPGGVVSAIGGVVSAVRAVPGAGLGPVAGCGAAGDSAGVLTRGGFTSVPRFSGASGSGWGAIGEGPACVWALGGGVGAGQDPASDPEASCSAGACHSFRTFAAA